MKDCGILYFLVAASKEWEERVMAGHGRYLLNSLESLRRHMPDISTALFTDIESVDWKKVYGFDIVNYTPSPSYMWDYKYKCLLETPFPKTIHMDCDTYVCDSFYEVFDMLDNIDIAIPISPIYFGRRTLGIPVSFPELACGFMAYNSSDKVKKMFEYTRELISARLGGCDEPYVRKALYEFTNVKHSVLPLEYNCVFWFPGFVQSKIKVLHGKTLHADIIEKCFVGKHPRLYTGDSVINCDYVRRRRYTMGSVKNYVYLIEKEVKK